MIQYVKASFKELKSHVTWLPWPEAQRLTIIVVVFSVLLALAVWGVDSLFSKIIGFYFDWIKA